MQIGRRIVTGHGEDGGSCVLRIDDAETRSGRYVYWHTDAMPVRISGPEEIDETTLGFLPAPSGTSLQLIELPPVSPDLPRAALEDAYAARFARLGASDCRGDVAKHPGMHITPTLDYVMLGSVDKMPSPQAG